MKREGINETTLIQFGGAIKALSDDGDTMKIGGYLVQFTSPDYHDSSPQRDYFDKDTDFCIDPSGAKSATYYHHGLNPTLKTRQLAPSRLTIDDVGVWFEGELNLRERYEAKIAQMVKMGKMSLSSGTAVHLVQRTPVVNSKGVKTNHIDYWPLGLDASLTPTPAHPTLSVQALKSVAVEELGKDIFKESGALKAAGPFKFCSTQLNLTANHAEMIREWAKENIPDEALAEGGREEDPHITILYGLESDERAPIQKLASGFGPIRANIGAVGIFESEGYDVVFCSVESPDIFRLRGRLETLPHTSTHPEYKPHITLAYVKKGMGIVFKDKYLWIEGDSEMVFDSFNLSDKNGELQPISTNAKAAAKSLDDLTESLPDGLSFDDHSTKVLAAAEELVGRAEALATKRCVDGRRWSAEKFQGLTELAGGLKAASEAVGNLAQAHAPRDLEAEVQKLSIEIDDLEISFMQQQMRLVDLLPRTLTQN